MKTLVLSLFCLAPCLVIASPTGALRDYKDGKFDQALKDYQQLLDRKGDDPRLHFNAGAAAYRTQQLDEAAKQFDQALTSPDLKLQEQAYYNRGNTLFYMGEQNPDPAKRTETWKKALQDFESSMKLAPQDQDAKFNHDLVKKRLEELQQQQQKSDKNKDDKQDQDQQKQQQDQQSKSDQQKQDQQKQDQQKQDQQKQGSSKQDQQKQDQQKQDQQQAQQQQQQQQAAKSEEQKQKEQQAAKPQEDKNQPSEEEKQEAAAAAAGEMTQKQAAQLLDAQKGNEQMMPSKPRKPTERTKPLKDW